MRKIYNYDHKSTIIFKGDQILCGDFCSDFRSNYCITRVIKDRKNNFFFEYLKSFFDSNEIIYYVLRKRERISYEKYVDYLISFNEIDESSSLYFVV